MSTLASDLGMQPAEVHAKAGEVLGFWFDLLMPEQHFAKSESVDTAIRERFEGLRDEVLANGAEGWRDEPDTLLAAIVLLDQFSRNMFRDDAEAFAADALAQELACMAIDRGWDSDMSPARRQFLYMPLMHAEDPALQQLCVTKFEQPGLAHNLEYAREHAEVVSRFGRFPTRNQALGRESTPQERAYLSQPDAGW